MNFSQNERINQISSSTLIVGVDIAKFKHVARAQDNRGVEFGKPITFENTLAGFELFVSKDLIGARLPRHHGRNGTNRSLL